MRVPAEAGFAAWESSQRDKCQIVSLTICTGA